MKPEKRFVWAVTLIGTAGFCTFAQSWQDHWHLIYDLAAAPVVFAFIGKVLVNLRKRMGLIDAWLLVPLVTVPVGAEFLNWPISGHLTDLLIALYGHTAHPGRSPKVLALWFTLLLVLYVRWFIFDINGHWRSINAIIVASICMALTGLAKIIFWEGGRMPTIELQVEGYSANELHKRLSPELKNRNIFSSVEITPGRARGLDPQKLLTTLPSAVSMFMSFIDIIAKIALSKKKQSSPALEIAIGFVDGRTVSIQLPSNLDTIVEIVGIRKDEDVARIKSIMVRTHK